MAERNEHDFALRLPFDTDAPEFTRGCEIGMLWERLGHDPGPLYAVAHAENAEMLLRLGEATGRTVKATQTSVEGWLDVWFGARSETETT